jgi:tetratricopeptide (TPR) repeat protein
VENLLRSAAALLQCGRSKGPVAHAKRVEAGRLIDAAALHHGAGRFESARKLYERAIELDPVSDRAHNLLGTLLCVKGDLTRGERSFRLAISANPANVDALNNLANVRKDQRDFAGAEAIYLEVLGLNPSYAAAVSNLGLLYYQTGRLDEALQSFRQVSAIDELDADARNNIASVLRLLGRLDEAEVEFRNAIALDVGHAEAYSGLADILQMRGLLDEAEHSCSIALRLRNSFPDAWNNLATIARARDDLKVAASHCNRALQDAPNHIGALNNLGFLALRQGDARLAATIYSRALDVDPHRASTRFNLSTALLMLGHYKEGFEYYESRFEAFGHPAGPFSGLRAKVHARPHWCGEDLGGGHVMIWQEQGLGDALMMLRFIPLLRSRGASRITVICDASLRRIVSSMHCVDDVVSSDEGVQAVEFDTHCSMMSLPRAFRVESESVPNDVPYIRVPDALSAYWRGRLNAPDRLVGIAWAGARTLKDDARRSIPFDTFAPLLSTVGATFVSLQKGDAADDWPAEGGGHPIDDCDDLMDTAALIMGLDLVIAVDTAVAHLAAALGKPVWLLSRFESEWRWGCEAESSVWYPTMRILRQGAGESWNVVIGRASDALRRMAKE